MTLSWLSINASTGDVIADLPTLRGDGALKQTLMRYESQTASLPMDAPPENWRQATRKGAVFLVALDESQQPVWGGMVIRRNTADKGDAKFSLVSAEAYFDRVYVGDVSFTNIPQNTIVKTLVEAYAKTGAKRGLPLRVEVIGGVGVARTQAYKDSEDKTLYSVLTDLSGLLGGPEWTVGWEWVNASTLGLVLSVGDRIGKSAPAGLGPAAQFYLPGSVSSASLDEGYGADEGSNDVMAVSTGTEGARPQSPHQTNTSDLRPRFEFRWTPSTSISVTDTLTSHAQRGLAAMKNGTVALAITANRQEAPQLWRDGRIGDDIGFDLSGPSWPDGISGVARCVGWEMTDTTITPLVDVTNIEGID